MWKPLQKTPPYFMRFIETETFYYVGVTDYHCYWINNTSRNTFLFDLKESNDGLEFDDENELVERGLDMLRNPETLKKVNILKEESESFLTISLTKVFEFPLKLEMSLCEASTKHLFSEVIQPLLKTVCDLRSSQFELRELLKKKDREIEEYKCEGRAPRRLITTVYDDAAHMIKHTTYEENFGVPEIPELLQNIANSGDSNKRPREQSARTPTETVQTGQATAAQSTTMQHPPESSKTPEAALKIEKFSQNSLIDEIASIVPTQIEEMKIPGSVVKHTAVEKTILKTENPMVPKKRPKTRLNY